MNAGKATQRPGRVKMSIINTADSPGLSARALCGPWLYSAQSLPPGVNRMTLRKRLFWLFAPLLLFALGFAYLLSQRAGLLPRLTCQVSRCSVPSLIAARSAWLALPATATRNTACQRRKSNPRCAGVELSRFA